MYEAHFGISGPPFQLSPDPTFYYDSKGHHDALAVLRRGLTEQRGVVVVSGEIGAGKTTLVRTLLGEIDPATLVVGQVLSTQLDDLELLRAILLAFGAPAEQDDADVLRRALQAHLMALAREGRRAVLIVDEAQNLHRSAFEMLAQLETGAVPGGLPIKVCLVGQPELRELVSSGELRMLRERVQASCHLAPLRPDETGAYVRHRLAKVGWSGTPSFEPGSLEEVHRWTSGVPRRINLLCNRLMLSRFLAAQTRIDAATVAQTAADLRAEIGDFSVPPPVVEPAAPPVVEPAPAPAASEPATPVPAEALPAQMLEPLAAPDIALDLPEPSVIAELPPAPPTPAAQPPARSKAPREPKKRVPPVLTSVVLAPESRPLVLVVGGQADHTKAAALMRAMAARRDLPVALLVRAYANNAFERNREMYAGLDVAGRVINLGIAGGTYAGRAAELMQRFEFVVDHCQPGAVVVFDGSDAALSCGLVASRKSVPVVQVGAGLRARVQGAADITRKLTDQLCDVLYTPEAAANERLLHEGVPAERLCFAGNLLVDALQMALRSSLGVASPRERLGIAPEFLSDRNGYGVVVLDAAANVGERQTFTELVTILRDVSRDVPLVWPMHTRTREQLAKFRLDALLRGERIACVPTQSYISFTQVLANATCVLTDSWHVQEETTALSIPCLTLGLEPERSITCELGSNVAVGRNKALATRTVWECIFNGGKRGRLPEHWDGQAGARIAEHLALWLKLALEQRAPAGVTSGA